MKKILLITVLGLFISFSATSFAASVNIVNQNPVVQIDDDPEKAETEESSEQKTECQKKCDKKCEKECCKKDKEKSECAK